MCDIDTINVRFYLLEIRYPHGYCKITPHCVRRVQFLISFLVNANEGFNNHKKIKQNLHYNMNVLIDWLSERIHETTDLYISARLL
jgi:hypothetical protein